MSAIGVQLHKCALAAFFLRVDAWWDRDINGNYMGIYLTWSDYKCSTCFLTRFILSFFTKSVSYVGTLVGTLCSAPWPHQWHHSCRPPRWYLASPQNDPRHPADTPAKQNWTGRSLKDLDHFDHFGSLFLTIFGEFVGCLCWSLLSWKSDKSVPIWISSPVTPSMSMQTR